MVSNMKKYILLLLLASCATKPPVAPLVRMALPEKESSAFSDSSPWNRPIDSCAKYSEYSEKIIGKISESHEYLNANISSWSVPVYFVTSSTPKVRVTSTAGPFHDSVDPNHKGFMYAPLTIEMKPDRQTDGHLVAIDKDNGISYEFGELKKTDKGWQAINAAVWDLKGLGYKEPYQGLYWYRDGARASGVPLIAGLILSSEIVSGEIKHALALSGPLNGLSVHGKNDYEVCSPVASNTDGYLVGEQYALEGTRFRLDPGLDISQFPRDIKVVAAALQKYGAFLVDNSGDFNIYFENVNGLEWVQWGKYIKVKDFKVMACDNVKVFNW